MSHDSITQSVTGHLSDLAKLTLTSEEEKKLASQLEETLVYIENLSELDTSTVDATCHSTDEHNVFFTDGEPSLNALTHDDALANASCVKKDCFFVDRIL